MGRVNDEKRNPILRAVREGRLDSTVLQKAAAETLAFADLNTRRMELDAKPDYGVKQEVACIEDRLPDGRYRLYTIQEGLNLTVVRPDRRHLLPEMTQEMIRHLCRTGVYNDWAEAKGHVQERVSFYVASNVGKVC